MLAYGARGIDANKSSADKPQAPEKQANEEKENLIQKITDLLSKMTVPHSWFTGFYVFTSLASAVWGHQLYTRGRLFQYIAAHTNYAGTPSMTFNQIILVWALFQFQGLRRLYESFAFSKPSNSRMSFVYFAMGIAYYMAMNMAMWIEGMRRCFIRFNPDLC